MLDFAGRVPCHVYFLIVLENTLPSQFYFNLYLIHRVLCEACFIWFIECSEKPVLFGTQSASGSLFYLVHRVLWEACFILYTECFTKPVLFGTQNALRSLFYLVHRVLIEACFIWYTEWYNKACKIELFHISLHDNPITIKRHTQRH